jgi:hypothetical protein
MDWVQMSILTLLRKDHGEPVIASLLPAHPLAQEFEIREGTILAKFKDSRFLIYKDGGFTPLSTPEENHGSNSERPKRA